MGRGGGRPGEEKRQRGKGRENEGESDQGSEVREGRDREEVKTSRRQNREREGEATKVETQRSRGERDETVEGKTQKERMGAEEQTGSMKDPFQLHLGYRRWKRKRQKGVIPWEKQTKKRC